MGVWILNLIFLILIIIALLYARGKKPVKLHRLELILFIVFSLLQFLDWLLSYITINVLQIATELNPIIGTPIDPVGTFLGKIILVFLVFVSFRYYFIRETETPQEKKIVIEKILLSSHFRYFILIICVLLYICVVVNNFIVLFYYLLI